MATRAIIRIAEREDGVSFSEHPEFLCDFRVVNGLPTNYFENIKVANGMGCLTAQLIAGLKEEAGNVYVDYSDTDRDDVEFTYYIWGCVGKDIWMSIFDLHDNCIFVGMPQQLIEKYQ
jgi:hypothetical protein